MLNSEIDEYQRNNNHTQIYGQTLAGAMLHV